MTEPHPIPGGPPAPAQAPGAGRSVSARLRGLSRDRLALLAAVAAPLALSGILVPGGLLQGRFLMTPTPGARPTREQMLLAVAFADHVGAALASSQLTRHQP